MTPTKNMGFVEFVAFTALMFASVAYAIDSMLPLIVAMGEDLSPDAVQRAQLVITTFVFGLGLGTYFISSYGEAESSSSPESSSICSPRRWRR